MLAPDEGLDHPNARQIFLHDRIHVVQPVLHAGEQVLSTADHGEEHTGEERNDGDEHQREPRAGGYRHDDTAYEHEGRAYRDSQEDHDGFLDLNHVVGQPRNQLAGAQPVQIAEGQGLDLPKQRGANVSPGAVGGANRKDGASHTADYPDGGDSEHGKPGSHDHAQVHLRDSHVDDSLQIPRLRQVHGHFEDHEQRRNERLLPVWTEKPGNSPDCRKHWLSARANHDGPLLCAQ